MCPLTRVYIYLLSPPLCCLSSLRAVFGVCGCVMYACRSLRGFVRSVRFDEGLAALADGNRTGEQLARSGQDRTGSSNVWVCNTAYRMPLIAPGSLSKQHTVTPLLFISVEDFMEGRACRTRYSLQTKTACFFSEYIGAKHS